MARIPPVTESMQLAFSLSDAFTTDYKEDCIEDDADDVDKDDSEYDSSPDLVLSVSEQDGFPADESEEEVFFNIVIHPIAAAAVFIENVLFGR